MTRLSLKTLLVVLALATAARAGDPALSIAIQPPEITAGESARVQLVLSWPGAQDQWTVEAIHAPEHKGAALTAVADDIATVQEGGQPRFRRQVTYVIQADEPGTISLSPAKVMLKAAGGAPRELKSESLGVIVKPGRGPVPTEAILAVLGLLGLAALVWIARTMNRPAPPPPPGRESRANERVDALARIGHRDHRQFFDACFDGLREGLADVAPAIARDRDRAKIVQALRDANVPAAQVAAADELIGLCDEARFNPEPPAPAVRERAMTLLRTALS